MTPLSPDPLIMAAARLIAEIGMQADNTEMLELQRLELCARGLCAQLKAIETLMAHNQRMAAIDTKQKYTRYEDLPPLTLEARDRLKQKLVLLLDPEGTESPEDELGGLPERLERRH